MYENSTVFLWFKMTFSKIAPETNLGVSDDGDPVCLGGTGNSEHGPEEDGKGIGKGEKGGRHHVVEDHCKEAHDLRLRHRRLPEGDDEQKETRHLAPKQQLLVRAV